MGEIDPSFVESAIVATEAEFRQPTDREGLRSRVLVFCATFRMAAETLGPTAAHTRLVTTMELLVSTGRALRLSEVEWAAMGLRAIETALTITHTHPSKEDVDRALAQIAALEAKAGDGA